MQTLHWLTREEDIRAASTVPYRTPVLVHLSGPRPFVHPPFERLRL
jgi:hypothetical protein